MCLLQRMIANFHANTNTPIRCQDPSHEHNIITLPLDIVLVIGTFCENHKMPSSVNVRRTYEASRINRGSKISRNASVGMHDAVSTWRSTDWCASDCPYVINSRELQKGLWRYGGLIPPTRITPGKAVYFYTPCTWML